VPRGVLRTTCRICERPVSEVGGLSARGKCAECGNARLLANHEAMLVHRGPFYEHWKRRTLAAFGVVYLDAERDEV
jgi:hypothetical protein